MTWTLYHGSCLDPVTGLATLGDKSVDVLITDPPYSQHTHEKQWSGAALTDAGAKRVKIAHKGLGFDHITEETAHAIMVQVSRVVRRWSVIFTDIEGIDMWRHLARYRRLEYVRTCIWDKVDGAPQFTGDRPAAGAEAFVLLHPPGKKRWNGGGRRNIFKHAVNAVKGAKPFPSTKPQALMQNLVQLFSDPDELVLDPFAGSGSTGVACRKLGRDFLGWEIDPATHAIAERRLRGQRALIQQYQPELF